MKLSLPLEKAHRLISPRISYIITTVDKKGNVNAGVFSNITSVSTDPERLVLSVYKKWDTIKNIRQTKEFVVNVPSKILLEEVWICGDKYAGNPIPMGTNELKVANLTGIPSEKVRPSRVKECYGHLECKVVWIKDVGDHYLVLGDIVSATFIKGYLDKDFVLDVSKARPLMEVARNIFTYPGETIEVNRQKVKSRVVRKLKDMKIRLSKKLSYYEENVFSED